MPPLLTTLGLFIIDENIYPKSSKRKPEVNIIGGGASYALIGGRFVAGPKNGARIAGIIDKGTDFPEEVEREIESWGTGAIFRENPHRYTTRGANIYGEDGVRSFVYRTPKRRIEGVDILEVPDLVDLESFHFCCSSERCEEIIDMILENRSTLQAPKFVFEPFPEVCVRENLEKLQNMLPKVDVFSPNLNEAADYVGLETLPDLETKIRDLAAQFLPYCSENAGVVLRCGPLGCYVLTHEVSIMLPAFHEDQDKVVDVTGGGNTYCGAFVTALCLFDDWVIAGVLANLASGAVIERLGTPHIDSNVWNGVSVRDRIRQYLKAHPNLPKSSLENQLPWWL